MVKVNSFFFSTDTIFSNCPGLFFIQLILFDPEEGVKFVVAASGHCHA